MDLRFTEEERAFRAEVRGFIDRTLPDETRARMASGRTPTKEQWGWWHGKLYERGWSVPDWAKEHGGPGWTPVQRFIFREELQQAPAPQPQQFGTMMVGPVIIAFGTDPQKRRFLSGIRSGKDWWCQGFSEPGAGSDLASLKTSAKRVDDHYIVNGQKTWTTLAHWADWIFALVRTDPNAPKKQEGIGFLLIDMKSPGITVRPIKNMAGVSHFAEVFYDDVRIPLSNVVGALDDGWRVAMTTLGFERKTAAMGLQLELSVRVEDLIALAAPRAGTATAERLADLRAEAAALRAMTYRALFRDPATASDGSLVRLHFAELSQRIHRAAMDILGPAALLGNGWTHDYLESYSETIAGGTAEIQRNIIAERILGLPREERS